MSQKNDAKKDLLALSDMPRGWASSAATNGGASSFSTRNAAADRQFASCAGVPLSLIRESPADRRLTRLSKRRRQRVRQREHRRLPLRHEGQGAARVRGQPQDHGVCPDARARTAALEDAGRCPFHCDVRRADRQRRAARTAHRGTSQGVTLPITVTEVYAIKGTLVAELSLTSIKGSLPDAAEQQIVDTALGRL
jgi:hypothetical protein